MRTLALLFLIWGISQFYMSLETPLLPEAQQTPLFAVYTTKTPRAELADGITCTSSELLRKQMVYLINKARSQPRQCGVMAFEGAPPVQWNYTLERAARLHAHNMATENFFAHRGPDSTHVGIRVQEFGYNWRYVGENIYAGIETVSEAVYGWLDSEGHCKTIMNPDYTELGAACVANQASQYESYWAQVFASPMKE